MSIDSQPAVTPAPGSNGHPVHLRVKHIILEGYDEPIDEKRVEALMASIKANGLINPIRVRTIGCDQILVAGRHRLEACKRLGWDVIDCMVDEADDDPESKAEDIAAAMKRLAENLHRGAMSADERSKANTQYAELLRKREAIPAPAPDVEVQAGRLEPKGIIGQVANKSPQPRGRPKKTTSARAIAAGTGQSRRTVARSLTRAAGGEKVTARREVPKHGLSEMEKKWLKTAIDGETESVRLEASATLFDVPVDMVRRAAHIREAMPDLLDKVKSGKFTLHEAEQELLRRREVKPAPEAPPEPIDVPDDLAARQALRALRQCWADLLGSQPRLASLQVEVQALLQRIEDVLEGEAVS